MTELPVIGAALRPRDLPRFLPWLSERDRDLELQGFDDAEVMDGDWRALAAEIRAALSGWNGRLGMHGPFSGLVLDARDPEARALAARRIDRALDIAAALELRQMVLHSPFTLWKHQNLDTRPGAREGMTARVQDTLGAAVARAEALGGALLSSIGFNDHTSMVMRGLDVPIQERAFEHSPEFITADPADPRMAARLDGRIKRSGMSDGEFRDLLAEIWQRRPEVPAAIASVAEAGRARGVPMLSHDDTRLETRRAAAPTWCCSTGPRGTCLRSA